MKSLLEKLKAKLGKKSEEVDNTAFYDTAYTEEAPQESAASSILSDNAHTAAPVKKALSSIRPPFEQFYPYILGSTIGLMGADLAVTSSRSFMIPDQAPPAQISRPQMKPSRMKSEYSGITSRNIFNSDGIIPDPINKKDEAQQEENVDGPAVASNLPIEVMGTIVHLNPAKSVASIKTTRGQTKVLPYIPNDDIEGIATLVKVERRKIFIRNKTNNRLEYKEMKLDAKINFGMSSNDTKNEVAPGLKKDGNKFKVSKTELKKQLNNLPELLRQARAQATRGEDGAVNGFRIVDIQPGSIIGNLVERGDVIKSVNGTALNSAAVAMKLYRDLKDCTDNISLSVERNGRIENLEFECE